MVSPVLAVRTAFGWLTVLPVGGHDIATDRRLGGATITAVPVVGIALGGVVALVGFALTHTDLPLTATAVLAVACTALLTRGMHLDGLADTADGLGCYGPPERVTAVMRSGTAGPFGVATLILVLGLQVVGLGAFFAQSRWYEVIFAVALGRLGVVIGARAGLAAAHPDGFGALVAGTQRRSIAVWFATFLICAALSGFDSNTTGFDVAAAIQAMVTVTVIALFAWVFTRHCARRMGGLSGDVLGAVIELGVALSLIGLLV